MPCLKCYFPAGAESSSASAGITPLSSLLLAHAPIPNPLLGSASALPSSLCRLLPAPAGSGTFPTLSLRVFPWMLGPVSRRLRKCMCSFLPSAHRPSPTGTKVGSTANIHTATSVWPSVSGRQSFLYVQASKFACHPGRSYLNRLLTLLGSRDVYFRAERMSLPSYASDMLAV